jgi:hypothetical protein
MMLEEAGMGCSFLYLIMCEKGWGMPNKWAECHEFTVFKSFLNERLKGESKKMCKFA